MVLDHDSLSERGVVDISVGLLPAVADPEVALFAAAGGYLGLAHRQSDADGAALEVQYFRADAVSTPGENGWTLVPVHAMRLPNQRISVAGAGLVSRKTHLVSEKLY